MSYMSYEEISTMKEFLLLYKSFPCLWDCKSDHFKDKRAREKALQVLLHKYRIMVPDANKDSLKRKIDMLKSSYKRELKKILNDHNHIPSLWYFPYLKFLDEQIFNILDQSGDRSNANNTASNDPTLLNHGDEDDDGNMIALDHSDDRSEEEKESITILYQSDDDTDFEETRDEVCKLAKTSAAQIDNSSVLYSLLTSDVEKLKKGKLQFQTPKKDPCEHIDEPAPKRAKTFTPTTSDRHQTDREQLIDTPQSMDEQSNVRRQVARKRTTQLPSITKQTRPDPLFIAPESPAAVEYPISPTSPESEVSLTTTQSEDETIAFGKAIGIQMKELSPLQKTIATKLISDVIFYGRLDKLTTQTSMNNLKEN